MSATSTEKAHRADLALVDQMLSDEAKSLKQTISSGGAPKISIDRSGRFIAPDGLDLGTEIRGVVVDYISVNRYYPNTYDPNKPEPPVCFAYGKVIGEMAPEQDAPEPQADACNGCPLNEFGSRGKGKACKNTRELAFVLEEDLESQEPKLYLISVSPTALRSFDAFANLCGRVLNGPPIKAIVTIKAVAQGSYTTMAFVDPDENPNYAQHFQLRDEALALISQTPDLSNYTPTKKSANAGRGR